LSWAKCQNARRLSGSCSLVLVTDPEPANQASEQVKAFFLDRGLTIVVSQSDGGFWAGLLNASGRMVAPRYGRGATPGEAADRAMRRHLEEQ
jgi:hypothetical protein